MSAIPGQADIPRDRPVGIRKKRWDLAGALIEPVLERCGGRERFFGRLFAYITAGGFITDLCADLTLDRGSLLAEIRGDQDLSRRYDAAVSDRKDARAEDCQALWADVMSRTPEDEPDWAHVLKASEMTAKNSGVLRDGPGQSVHIHAGGNSLIAILSGIDAGEQDGHVPQALSGAKPAQAVIECSARGAADVSDAEVIERAAPQAEIAVAPPPAPPAAIPAVARAPRTPL